MKHLLVLLSFTAACLCARGQAPQLQWQHSIGSSAYETAYCIEQTADSGYIAICITNGSDGDFAGSYGFYDIWVVRMSPWGDVLWKKRYGGSQDDKPTSIMQTADGGYIFSAYTTSTDGDISSGHGGHDYWAVKLDDTGKIQWQRTYGGSGVDVMSMIRQTSDGGYVAVGQTTSTDGDITLNRGSEDIWVLKLSATGTIQWQKTYGGTDEEDGCAVRQTADGGYIVAGNTKSTDGDVSGNHGADVYALKLDDTGAIEWLHCYGGSGLERNGDHSYPGNIEQTTDGGYIFACYTNSIDGDVTGLHGTAYDSWVVKLDAGGSIEWQKTLGGTNNEYGFSADVVPGGGYIIANASASADGDVTSPIALRDVWMVKLTSAGSIEWQRSYGGNANEEPFYIRAVNDSSFIMCGFSSSTDVDLTSNNGDYDVWIAKMAYCSLPATAPIAGVNHACAGNVIYLSNSTTGGIWTASNGNASVFAGMVTAVYAGNVAISYAVANSCGMGGATYHFVVDPLPEPVISQVGSVLSTTTPFATYQWFKDGVSIAGATSATYTVTAHATYSVTVTNAFGCMATTGMAEGVNVSLLDGVGRISIGPNPAADVIYIQGTRIFLAQLYNSTGQLVRAYTGSNSLSVSGLPTGVYLLRVFDKEHKVVAQEKVMKE